MKCWKLWIKARYWSSIKDKNYVAYHIFFNNIYSSCDAVNLSCKNASQHSENTSLAY